MNIPANFKLVLDTINYYEQQFHRQQDSVKLLVVSKGISHSLIEQVYDAGQTRFAESYLQEARLKIASLEHLNIEWHFIGRLQKNKIKEIVKIFSWIQSVCQLDHVNFINTQMIKKNTVMNVCIQVNVSQDKNKAGLKINDVLNFSQAINKCKHLRLRGLMTIIQASDDFMIQSHHFSQLLDCYMQLKKIQPSIDTLSMGMSNDYKAAIAEGSNMVRLGKAIFGTNVNQSKEIKNDG